MKRLENDGAIIRINQHEKDLLNIYCNQEEEDAHKDL
jgi:hypothetical protein